MSIIGNKKLWLLTVLSVMLLASCSDDSEPEARKSSVLVELQPVFPSYVDVKPIAHTRTWDPDPYVTYTALNSDFAVQANLFDKNIGVFFTKSNGDKEQGVFTYGSGDKWRSSIESFDATTPEDPYYLYGYTPTMNSIQTAITGNPTFADGAVLTLSNLPTVTVNDVCIIVGAKAGSSADDDTGRTDQGVSDGKHLTQGQFAVVTKAQAQGNAPLNDEDKNYIFLLFDHLYSAMHLTYMVDPEYDALRTIVLKEIKLKPYGATAVKSKVQAVISLKATTNGTSPIKSVVFNYDNESGETTEPIYKYKPESDDPVVVLSPAPTHFRGGFVPQDVYRFMLSSTYDVYDKKVTEGHPYGNLVRENCVAENMLDFSDPSMFNRSHLDKGFKYQVKLIIKPTYLYVLSEPDVDNPTVEVGN